jgi:hypothetical protein
LRTQCKKVTDGKVEGFYQLIAGEEAINRVKALTDENQDYLYPLKAVRFPVFLFFYSESLIIGHRSFRMETLKLNGHTSIHASSHLSRSSFLPETVEH